MCVYASTRAWAILFFWAYCWVFYKDCPGSRYGALLARIDCNVCVCFNLSFHIFFDLGMPTIDHCCVPRCSNRRRTSPSLSYHHNQSFPLSSELRKRCLVAITGDNGANFCMTKSPVLCSEHFLPNYFHFSACAQESADSSITGYSKPRKSSRFLKVIAAVVCHRCFLFTHKSPCIARNASHFAANWPTLRSNEYR